MTLPTFLVLGCMKGGTTSLYRYLGQHPDVFVATPKELHFFSRHWDRGPDWYASHFAEADPGQARGEVSPSYTAVDQHPLVASRIAELIPEARLIYLARDPVSRAASHYRQAVLERRETLPFPEAAIPGSRYVNRSCHGRQLEPFAGRFDAGNVLVVASEGLREERQATMSEIFRFLGVDPAAVPAADLASEYHETRRKAETPQWSPLVRPLVDAARTSGVLRGLALSMPAGLRKVLARFGTVQLDRRSQALLATATPDAAPEATLEVFARDMERLGRWRALEGLPWADRYR